MSWLRELMSCQSGIMSCQKIFWWVMKGDLAAGWFSKGERVFSEFRWKGGWMWTRFRLHAFVKVPPFSPSDCASKIALNEASKFEFEVGANFASFGKMLQKCLVLFTKNGNCCFMSFSLPTSLPPCQLSSTKAPPRMCGAHVGPPTLKYHQIVKMTKIPLVS